MSYHSEINIEVYFNIELLTNITFVSRSPHGPFRDPRGDAGCDC